jgi:hypothetical protein
VLCHGSSITYHACSLFSLCRRLLITTNLVCYHFESAWCWPGTGETLPPCNVSESMLLSPAHTGVCARLESAWLPAGVAGVRPQLQPRCSTARAVNPPTCGCQTCSGIAFPLTLSWATRPLRLENQSCSLAARGCRLPKLAATA